MRYDERVDNKESEKMMTELQNFYFKKIQLQIYILREETTNPDFNKILELNNLKAYCKLYKETI